MTSSRNTGEWNLALRQQAVVARLGQRGLAGAPVHELLEESALAVADALRVDRAALLELLPSWRELAVRAAVQEGVPVPTNKLAGITVAAGRETQSGYTLMVGGPVITPDLSSERRYNTASTPTGAGLTALIGWEDQPWGVLAVATDGPRDWSDDDVHFLQSVGNVVGLAIQRHKIEDELRESNTRLDLSLAAGGLGTWVWDVVARTIDLSPTLLRMGGLEHFEGGIDDYTDLVIEEDRHALDQAADQAFQQGRDLHSLHRLRRPDGEIRWIEVRGRPVLDVAGRPLRMVGVATDVTERRILDDVKASLLRREHEARVAAEQAQGQLSFLATATGALNASLDPATTIEHLGRLVVPQLCDLFFVDLIDEAGNLVPATAGHGDEEVLSVARELRRRRREIGGGGGLWDVRKVAFSGRTELISNVTDEMLQAAAGGNPDHLDLYRRVSGKAAAVVPMVAHGRVLGVLTFVSTTDPRRFGEDNLHLINGLASRAAMAIDNANLFAARNRVARVLQATLLPPALPEIPAFEVAARYRVAEAGTEIGGDFYDVFEVSDGAWTVVIGDVCGRGPEAAALTGLMRHSVRVAAMREARPSRILGETNEAILDQIDDTRFCTAAIIHLDAGTTDGQVHITASSAGHPCPVVVRPDGRVEPIDCAGTLLGVLSDPPLVDASLDLEPGTLIVSYTDGVTEARRGPDWFGEERLYEVLADVAGQPAEEVAARVDEAVAAFQDASNDDLAVLVLRVSA